MLNINTETGLKCFSINNDENKVIWFNPADVNIISRLKKASEELSLLAEDTKPSDDIDVVVTELERLDGEIRRQMDCIFDYPVSDIVFGATSPMATIKGVPYFERFLNAVLPVLEQEMKDEYKAMEKRLGKYTEKYKK